VGKNAIIFHGTGANPEIAWYPWLGKRLTERGYAVTIPHYPGMNIEPVAELLPKVLASHDFDENSVLIGHSGGAAFLLALLEHIDVTVAQAVLVAGYSTEPNTEKEPVLQASYHWDAIRSHVRDLYFITSVQDPYGCDAAQGRAMFDQLGGTQIIRNDGHFGDYNQPFETFELLDRLIP
jgi:predicted alpha/beta hydrolase family esterase